MKMGVCLNSKKMKHIAVALMFGLSQSSSFSAEKERGNTLEKEMGNSSIGVTKKLYVTATAPDPRYEVKPQGNSVQGGVAQLCFGKWLPKKHADVELRPLGWQKLHADWCNSTLAGKSPEFVANAMLNRIFTQPAIFELAVQQSKNIEKELNVHPNNRNSSNASISSFNHPFRLEFVILSKEQFKKLKPATQLQLSRYEEWGTEGFAYSVINRSITIYGKTQLAHEHAVFHMLENVFACNYYTADAVDIPLLSQVKLKPKEWNKVFAATNITKQVVPVFKYREVFYGEARRGIYAQWHGLSYGESAGTFENHPGWGMWVHTLHRLLPPDKYFAEHPEYYALRNGVRLKDQVCMSSEGALKAVIQQLKMEMEKNPSATYWSVSQMDNYNHCECDQCQSVDQYEGSHSGSLLRFVNQVASVFPHKVISTLAYQYSRRPPKLTKPLPNVNIMLCTIEENRAVDLRGTSFERDLADWSALTKNILIWDYVINFSHMVMPFPNFHILPTNMFLFQKYGVPMVFEQGYNSVGSEMQELRCFLLSKLMWTEGQNLSDSPNREEQYFRPRYSQSAKKEIKQTYEQFINGYYGRLGGWVLSDMGKNIRELWDSKKPLTLYEPPINHADGFLRLNKVEESLNFWSSIGKNGPRSQSQFGMQQHMADSLLLFRVQRLMQPYRYAFLEIAKYPEITEGGLYRWRNKLDSNEAMVKTLEQRYQGLEPIYGEMLDQFVAFANQHGPKLLHEIKLSPDDYKKSVIEYCNNAISTHSAVGKKLLYISVPDKAYQAKALGWRGEPLMMTTVLKASKVSTTNPTTAGEPFNPSTQRTPQNDSFIYRYLHVKPPEWVRKAPNGELVNVGIGKPVQVCISPLATLKEETFRVEEELVVSPVEDADGLAQISDSMKAAPVTGPATRNEKRRVSNTTDEIGFRKFTHFRPFARGDNNNDDFSMRESKQLDSISANLSLLPNVWYVGQPLVDGIRANEEYQRNWQGWWGRHMQVVIDLGALDTVRSVSIHYLENNQAWIVGPSKMTVAFDRTITDLDFDNQAENLQSALPTNMTDARKTPNTQNLVNTPNSRNPSRTTNTVQVVENYQSKTELKIPPEYRFSHSLTANNEQVGKQLPLGIGKLEVKPDKPIVARYLTVTVYNPGPLPKWRGVNGEGWLFVDEIEVK